MSELLQDHSPSAMVTAIEANLWEFWAAFRHWPQAEYHDDPDLLWTISRIPFPLFNCVLRANLTPDAIDSTVETAIGLCRSRDVPMLWRMGPSTSPRDLGDKLVAHGFEQKDDLVGMAVHLESLVEDVPMPSDFRIQRVEEPDDFESWRLPFGVGYSFPDFVVDACIDQMDRVTFREKLPIHHYIGWLEGEPVASSSVFFGAGVAGIYAVATIPAARRQGIGSLMTLRPLREAREIGHRIGILHSSKMAVNVYRQLGFEEYCRIRQYVWSPGDEEGSREHLA